MCAQLILLVLVLWTLHEQSGPEATYGYSGGDDGCGGSCGGCGEGDVCKEGACVLDIVEW